MDFVEHNGRNDYPALIAGVVKDEGLVTDEMSSEIERYLIATSTEGDMNVYEKEA